MRLIFKYIILCKLICLYEYKYNSTFICIIFVLSQALIIFTIRFLRLDNFYCLRLKKIIIKNNLIININFFQRTRLIIKGLLKKDLLLL